MAHEMIKEESQKENGYSKSACFRMVGVSSTGYYNWLKKQEDRDGKKAIENEEMNQIKEKFRKIIHKLGFVPGKRIFRTQMWRDYHDNISVKKCAQIMKQMNLVANLPKKDAYKGRARHFHECCAKNNYVAQNFKIGPRRVILTDITYLYYGLNRTLCYLCAFKDAFTHEILGYYVHSNMDVKIVKEAYERMMRDHRKEIKTNECFVHSDQGSVYLSTDFQTLLKNDRLIQSMSARGNSQDNAPMESFFGHMKAEIIDIIALCPNLDTVKRLIDGYMNSYNHERYQYSLAGLSPSEFYTYMISGIYPLDNYYGVQSSELLSVNELVAARLKQASEKAEKRRIASQKKREEQAQIKSPIAIVARDQKILKKEIKKWEQSKEISERQLKKLNEIYEKTIIAAKFINTCTDTIRESLKKPQNWQIHNELSYVNSMGELF